MNSDNQVSSFTIHYERIVTHLLSPITVYQPLGLYPEETRLSGSYKALWDTGATLSVVTDRVIDDCELEAQSAARINTVTGAMYTAVYNVDMCLPSEQMISFLPVAQGELAGVADVLIGMDIIGLGDFAVSNYNNQTSMSFRTPSAQAIDF